MVIWVLGHRFVEFTTGCQYCAHLLSLRKFAQECSGLYCSLRFLTYLSPFLMHKRFWTVKRLSWVNDTLLLSCAVLQLLTLETPVS